MNKFLSQIISFIYPYVLVFVVLLFWYIPFKLDGSILTYSYLCQKYGVIFIKKSLWDNTISQHGLVWCVVAILLVLQSKVLSYKYYYAGLFGAAAIYGFMVLNYGLFSSASSIVPICVTSLFILSFKAKHESSQSVVARFGMVIWVAVLFFAVSKQNALYGLSNSMVVSAILQLIYIVSESIKGHLINGTDKHKPHIFWNYTILVPSINVSTLLYLIDHPVMLNKYIAVTIVLLGTLLIYFSHMKRNKVAFIVHPGLIFLWTAPALFYHAYPYINFFVAILITLYRYFSHIEKVGFRRKTVV